VVHASTIDDLVVQRSVDQRVFLHNVSWSDYEALLAMRGDTAGVRVAYLEGTLELMTPSQDHEIVKKKLARLLEAYAEELGIELEGYGSWTLKREDQERGLEPDECY
jgi:Uma2 family endonuclease